MSSTDLPHPRRTIKGKEGRGVSDEYSMMRYAIEMGFISKLNDCKWYQFNKKRKARDWRERMLKKYGLITH